MKLTINLDVSSYGQEATEDDRDQAVAWMRELAELLGMGFVTLWHEGTDDAQEIWADADQEDYEEDEDIGERAFACWCAGDTPADAAAKIKAPTDASAKIKAEETRKAAIEARAASDAAYAEASAARTEYVLARSADARAKAKAKAKASWDAWEEKKTAAMAAADAAAVAAWAAVEEEANGTPADAAAKIKEG